MTQACRQSERIWYSLYGRLDKAALESAFGKVKKSKGRRTPGIDGQTVLDFEAVKEAELTKLFTELKEKSYRPLPVRRVAIPKEGGGTRNLGIPAVRDKVVQQALLDILQPIFDPHFHPSSYGYRPGKSCHHAIAKANKFMRGYELKWVVDMDLSKCFDTLDHDLIIKSFRKRIADGSVLKLLRLFLESGIIGEEGQFAPSESGSPQGGIISPLIANVYLDNFDQYMMSEGHRIVRYADDILILCGSEKAARRMKIKAEAYLEGKLKLTVNKEKTHIAHLSEGVAYLGVVMKSGASSIKPKKLKVFKQKVKALTKRNGTPNIATAIKNLNPLLRGFANYFRISNCKQVFRGLMEWLRRRLRALQLKLWKKPSRLRRRLRQLGRKARVDHIKMSSWHNSRSQLANMAMPNKWFTELGLFNLEEVECGLLPRSFTR